MQWRFVIVELVFQYFYFYVFFVGVGNFGVKDLVVIVK